MRNTAVKRIFEIADCLFFLLEPIILVCTVHRLLQQAFAEFVARLPVALVSRSFQIAVCFGLCHAVRHEVPRCRVLRVLVSFLGFHAQFEDVGLRRFLRRVMIAAFKQRFRLLVSLICGSCQPLSASAVSFSVPSPFR